METAITGTMALVMEAATAEIMDLTMEAATAGTMAPATVTATVQEPAMALVMAAGIILVDTTAADREEDAGGRVCMSGKADQKITV